MFIREKFCISFQTYKYTFKLSKIRKIFNFDKIIVKTSVNQF